MIDIVGTATNLSRLCRQPR